MTDKKPSVLKTVLMANLIFFSLVQIYMVFGSMGVIEKRSQVGYLAKTKSGKVFLLNSSMGRNSTKKNKKISRDYGEKKLTDDDIEKVKIGMTLWCIQTSPFRFGCG